ncbi:hypothetical protein OAH97_00485 [Octadecabacter sp.]|nr:hypothetical protein [Octadecabacter sp.]
MDFPDLTTGLIFAAICLTASVGVVHLSGFVPTEGQSRPRLKPMLAGGLALVLALTVVGLGLAITHVGLALAIVIAGSAFLIAPFLVEPLPAPIKDGTLGLGIFIAVAVVALGFGITETWGT